MWQGVVSYFIIASPLGAVTWLLQFPAPFLEAFLDQLKKKRKSLKILKMNESEER